MCELPVSHPGEEVVVQVRQEAGWVPDKGLWAVAKRKNMFPGRKYKGRTESHEQLFFLHANWEQQTKESAVVDGTAVVLSLIVLWRQ